MEPIRVGFIGCGRHATKMLYPSLHMAKMQLVSVCDLNEKRAQRNARWFGAQRVYTDHKCMIDSEKLDAVLICTGPSNHAQLTYDTVGRGLPVFLEKPPALTLAETKDLHAYAQKQQVPVMVGLMKRYSLIYQRLSEIIHDPSFGRASAVQARMATGWKNSNGFALLLDMGIHIIDLLYFLMGDVAHISFQKYEQEGTYINYAILLRFVSGAVGTLYISDQHHWMRNTERIEITGSNQFVVAENLIHLSHYRSDGQIHVWEPGFSIPNDENHSNIINGYVGELSAFSQAIRTGTPVKPNLGDASAVLQFIKDIEPEENYVKGEQIFKHWQSENHWLEL